MATVKRLKPSERKRYIYSNIFNQFETDGNVKESR